MSISEAVHVGQLNQPIRNNYLATKLKNKDEDGVVENNEGLPQALLGSCNDCARQLQASSSERLLDSIRFFLAVLCFAIANYFAGFFIFLYIVLPIFYWSNTYDAHKFPFYTSQTFDHAGHSEKDFDINLDAYNGYRKLYLSLMFALLYGLSFASFFATISHVTLYDGTFIWRMWKKATTATKDKFGDVHSRLMKNYQAVSLTQIRGEEDFLLVFGLRWNIKESMSSTPRMII
ncbi:unnamed protein product [Brassica napus]|uniref:(rape) hypothetical protein n=1 Tax=Brassica napus TaxID=3708 RepID=A0A816PRI8_BRANA|nr:unnamed protein product [Brassica napus]